MSNGLADSLFTVKTHFGELYSKTLVNTYSVKTNSRLSRTKTAVPVGMELWFPVGTTLLTQFS